MRQMSNVIKRRPLPNRRLSETVKLVHNGFSFFVTIGYYDDGKPGDIFVSTAKLGTSLSATASDAAILISYFLQVGADTSEILSLIQRDEKGGYSSIVGALLDLLVEREHGGILALPGMPVNNEPAEPTRQLADRHEQANTAMKQGFTGDCCTSCGGYNMRRNGTCLLCTDCGTTTGCS